MTKLGKAVEKMLDSIDKVESGELSIPKAKVMCSLANAGIKHRALDEEAERTKAMLKNIDLQYIRIKEREKRYDKIFARYETNQ